MTFKYTKAEKQKTEAIFATMWKMKTWAHVPN